MQPSIGSTAFMGDLRAGAAFAQPTNFDYGVMPTSDGPSIPSWEFAELLERYLDSNIAAVR